MLTFYFFILLNPLRHVVTYKLRRSGCKPSQLATDRFFRSMHVWVKAAGGRKNVDVRNLQLKVFGIRSLFSLALGEQPEVGDRRHPGRTCRNIRVETGYIEVAQACRVALQEAGRE